MKKTKIGITGASGFIGEYLLLALSQNENLWLRPLYRKAPFQQALAPNIHPMTGDLNSPSVCAEFCRDLDIIIHLAHNGAPLSSVADLASNMLSNLVPSLNLIQAIHEEGKKPKVIFSSSGGAIYGLPDSHTWDNPVPFTEKDLCNPQSFYGIQKHTIEQYLRLAAESGWLSAVILRISNPYGIPLPLDRKQGIIGIAIQQAFNGLKLPIYGSLDNVRDYIHLEDVARGIEAAFLCDSPHEIFNISSGKGYSLRSVLELVTEVTGLKVLKRIKDTDNMKHQLVPWVVTDPSKAHKQLGWTATINLESGIRKLYELVKHG